MSYLITNQFYGDVETNVLDYKLGLSIATGLLLCILYQNDVPV